jgi:alkanesulfonate monooxygenase SsuD/methylene tetrahydromethanopterin reductase-like flavin-dependent oxidoreductase (luciferase family)
MAVPPIGVFLPTLGVRDASLRDPVAAAVHAASLGFESVWAVDQLVVGNGDVGILESTLVLAGAAVATERIRLGAGVLIVPLRNVAWAAKQVATLQHLSGDRCILGVGAGGNRHERSWTAAGVPRRERGRRLDAALAVLPDLIAGNDVDDVRLAPGATVPPIIVGGGTAAAVARAEAHDGWFLPPMAPARVAEAGSRVSVPMSANLTVALAGDETVPSRNDVLQRMTDPAGLFGIPLEIAEQLLAYGDIDDIAEQLHAYGDAGAARVVVTFAAGDWNTQAELLAHAAGQTNPSHGPGPRSPHQRRNAP